MPARRIVKTYDPNQYYRVFNHGWTLTKIFNNKENFTCFDDYKSPRRERDDIKLNCMVGWHKKYPSFRTGIFHGSPYRSRNNHRGGGTR
jgi:hypothetical protein